MLCTCRNRSEVTGDCQNGGVAGEWFDFRFSTNGAHTQKKKRACGGATQEEFAFVWRALFRPVLSSANKGARSGLLFLFKWNKGQCGMRGGCAEGARDSSSSSSASFLLVLPRPSCPVLLVPCGCLAQNRGLVGQSPKNICLSYWR